ncbi:LysR substrate-binding domain-containing protein [Paraburkholderia phenoliruptrix]|uniref:LysR substrate-binding domain-containing protein n=1 Tax=Paraburkholderia phenoliruptrix TaxID=252970 RepID=UPI0039B41589
MDVRQLKHFVAIVDSRSLSKAAERLFVSQPSLSQQILNLEKDLGVQLLIRSPQGVVPTEAGKTLYRLARDVLRSMELIRKEVKGGTGGESGTVSIGFPATVGAILAAPLFRRVKKTYPGIRLQIYESITSRINELLVEGRLDLAVMFRESDSFGVSGEPLFHESFYVVGHQLSELKIDETTCPLRALEMVPIVAPGPENGLRLLLERTFSEADVALNVVADIDSIATLVNIAEAGDACAMFAASALANCRFAPSTPIRKIIEPEMTRTASLCWNNSIPTLAAAHVIRETVVQLIEDLQASDALVGVRAA